MIKNIKKLGKFLFQTLGHQLFFFLYGRINGISEPNEEKRISVRTSNLDNHNYKVYQVRGGRLYTDTINDTAVIVNNKIVEGPSFQYRIVKNTDVKDNIVFEKGTPRIKKNINGNVLSLLTRLLFSSTPHKRGYTSYRALTIIKRLYYGTYLRLSSRVF